MDKEKWKGMLSLLSKHWWLLLLAVCGVLLLCIGGAEGKGEIEESPFEEAERYRLLLEERITELCNHVDGVSDVQVLLTVASGRVAVYATDDTAGGSDVVTAGGEAVLSAYAYPEVTGVAVVCRGGEKSEVQKELTELLSAALGISAARIRVCGAGIS